MVILTVSAFDMVSILLGSSRGKIHKLEENLNILLQDVDMASSFSYGVNYSSKNYTGSGFQFAEEMLDPHRIFCVLGVVVEIPCAATPPDFA